MATNLWRDLEAAFDSTIDDATYEFNESAAAMLLVVQHWLYEQGFDEAGDLLDDEIVAAEESA
jgi:hypothetical protein